MAEPFFYQTKDPDLQGMADYAYLLWLWTPTDRMVFAVERLQTAELDVVGYNKENVPIITFNRGQPYLLQKRSMVERRSEDDVFEEQLEQEQTKQMRQKRVERTLGPAPEKGYDKY